MAVSRRGKTQSANAKQLTSSKPSRTLSSSKSNGNLVQQILARSGSFFKGSAGSSSRSILVEEHLPPLSLILCVVICSGPAFILAMRDFFSTGRNVAGSGDEALLDFTRSTQWFDNSNGWKSTQGGFSAVQAVTTDANNMGGLFVRKIAGAAAVGVYLHKFWPLLLSHPHGAQWKLGHFRPLLATAICSNLALIAFYASYFGDLSANHPADLIPKCLTVLLALESLVFLYFLASQSRLRSQSNRVTSEAVLLTEGKTPSSVTSRIVSRTVLIVSVAITIVAGRDLLSPGSILRFIPRDDIYLEWTGAFLHSPPEDTPEADEHGLEAPLYIGEKFMAQYAALHILLLCLYKFVSALMIRYGADGRGLIQSRMMWQSSAMAGGLLLFVVRVFQPAALSASLDLRWHLMMIGYETFILGLYGFL